MISRVHARAPLRVSFAGGGSDLPGWLALEDGAALNATVAMYAYAELEATHDDVGLTVTANDLGVSEMHGVNESVLGLLHAAVRAACASTMSGRLSVSSDAPPGTGVGGSAAIVVAALAAFEVARGREPGCALYRLARKAWRIERVELGIPGGLQDQHATVFGGFNLMRFKGDDAVVEPIRLSQRLAADLEQHLVMVYTGVARMDGRLLEKQATMLSEAAVRDATRRQRDLAFEMAGLLASGDLSGFVDGLRRSMDLKRWMAPHAIPKKMDELITTALAAGARGARLMGAGGGGYLMIGMDPSKRGAVLRELERAGMVPIPVRFDFEGVAGWKT